MSRVAISGGDREEVIADLWGVEYTVQPATRSVIKKVSEIEEKLNAVTDPDEAIECLSEMLDFRLKAVNGGGKASTHIKKKWKGDELTIADLEEFADNLAAAERPT